MKLIGMPFLLGVFFLIPCSGQLPGNLSFLSTTSPGNCNTTDNAIVTSQTLFGSGAGFGCLKTLIILQTAIGSGWTSQAINFMPALAPIAGLVNGTTPSFRTWITAGSGATFTAPGSAPVPFNTAMNGCLGLWSPELGGAFPLVQGFSFRQDSGTAGHGSLTSVATVGACAGGVDTQIPGLAQGPIQYQIVAPNAQALSQATVQLSYFLVSGNTSWQVTVNAVDINSAKPRWTAPLFQGNGYVTAFSVVNASNTAQTVSVALRDDVGNSIGTSKLTPSLPPGCGCNQFKQNAVGGYYADTVTGLFGDIGTQTGSIEFTGSSGNIMVLVLRVVNNSLGSVPAR
jgi:hypothetical protein